MRECRRCLLREAAEEDTYKSVMEKVEKIPARDRAPEEIYRTRLAACASCDHLLAGVCMKCGCYVEFRADEVPGRRRKAMVKKSEYFFKTLLTAARFRVIMR